MYVFDGMFYLAKLSVAAAGRLSVHVGIKRCIFTVAAVRAEKGVGGLTGSLHRMICKPRRFCCRTLFEIARTTECRREADWCGQCLGGYSLTSMGESTIFEQLRQRCHSTKSRLLSLSGVCTSTGEFAALLAHAYRMLYFCGLLGRTAACISRPTT